MSNADDRCARDGCGWPRKHHNPFGKYPCNAFVEPCPQVAPSGETAEQLRARLGWPPLTEEQRRGNLEHNLQSLGVTGGERREAAPSGDEAKVERCGSCNARRPWGQADCKECRGFTAGYAAGKADEALEKNGQWLGDMLLKIFADGWMGAQVAMRNAIERRGSEGK